MEIRTNISASDFNEMREAVNWKQISIEQLDKALQNTMVTIGIYENYKIVAMGRLIGDYSCKAMLTDIIVKPEYQKKGYGKLVVTQILNICRKKLSIGEKLCIEATPTAHNKDFYVNCGMKYLPEEQDGVFMWIENN